MSLFKKLKAGLGEALEFDTDRKKSKAKVRKREVKIAPAQDFNCDEIKEIRQILRLNQVQFAMLVGVSHETVAKWEQGVNAPARSSMRLLEILREKPQLPAQIGILSR